MISFIEGVNSLLPPEIISHIDVELPEYIVCTKLILMIVVSVVYGTCSGKPFGIVPYQSEAHRTIEGEVANPEVLDHILQGSVVSVSARPHIRQGAKQLSTKEPVLCKRPVIAITNG